MMAITSSLVKKAWDYLEELLAQHADEAEILCCKILPAWSIVRTGVKGITTLTVMISTHPALLQQDICGTLLTQTSFQ